MTGLPERKRPLAAGWNVPGATVSLLDRADQVRVNLLALRERAEQERAVWDRTCREIWFLEATLKDVELGLARLEPEVFGTAAERPQ